MNIEYINRLKSTKTYVADDETIRRRQQLESPRSLQEYSVDDLSSTKSQDESAYVAVLGYVVKMPRNKCYFTSHLGRDITARSLRHFRALPLDKDDDMGRPPYPDLSTVSADEKEYLNNWLDHYMEKGVVVGFVKEYLQQLGVKTV